MANGKQMFVVVGMLLVGSCAGVVLMGGTGSGTGAEPESGKRNLPVVQGPELADESLKATVTAASARRGQASGSEVELSGRMHGVTVEEVVFRSQESPDMLRLGWEAADHLVISVPQFSQDAGKAAGEGDSTFLCTARSRAVVVSCDTYPVGAR